jgi:acyltransferase-like protein
MFEPMFVPPRHNPALQWFATTFVPWLGPFFGNVRDVEIAPEDLARLEGLGPSRAILSPNHPTETDPIVLFWLSRMLGQPFNYLATRETLEGPRGWLLNRVGVYSVIRGFPDRESLRMTRRLLAEMDRKIVIFPEGLVYEHNDRLLQFQTGVAQMAFWALDDLEKAGKELYLPIVPIALKYRCCAPPGPAIERGLRDLERTLELPPDRSLGAYKRLLRIGGQVLATIEREEGIKADETLGLSERITAVRRAILERVAKATGAEIDDRQPAGDQLHTLFNELKSWVGVLPEERSEYDERRYRQRVAVAAPLFEELTRLHNFVAVTGDYIIQEPSAERFLEVLGRLQKEVLGQVRHAAPLKAMVRIGPPLPLHERYAEYRENKRGVVADVTRQMQESIWTMLRAMAGEATPLTL